MITIEVVVKNGVKGSFVYQSSVVPRIKEVVVYDNGVYEVLGVIHYVGKDNFVTLMVEKK